jgi:hypothetical protein
MYPYIGDNTVWVPLGNPTIRTTYDSKLHPWRNQYLQSVQRWGLDTPLFQSSRVSARLQLSWRPPGVWRCTGYLRAAGPPRPGGLARTNKP